MCAKGRRPLVYSCTRVNVGLVTSCMMPRPRAMPLTSAVLPAPRSPESASTSPGRSSAARRSPNCNVSSMLSASIFCEVIITCGRERCFRSVAFNESDLVMGTHHTADLGEFRAEFARPFLAQSGDMARIDGEEQFKVLTVVERGGQFSLRCARDGNFRGIDFKSGPARADVDEALEIIGQSVTEIDHCMNGEMVCEPAGFVDAGNKREMFATQRAAKCARHENRVTDFRAAAQGESGFLDFADESDDDKLFVLHVGGITTDNLTME